MGGSGINWTICKSFAPRSRQITMPVPHHSVFTGQMSFLPPNQQRQSTEGNKHWRQYEYHALWQLISDTQPRTDSVVFRWWIFNKIKHTRLRMLSCWRANLPLQHAELSVSTHIYPGLVLGAHYAAFSAFSTNSLWCCCKPTAHCNTSCDPVDLTG